MSGRTAVYRAYDSRGRLLYIGISKDWGTRWSQHAKTSPFYPHVAELQVRWCATRAIARKIEAFAIEHEQPPGNRIWPPERGLIARWWCAGCGTGYSDWEGSPMPWAFGTADRCPDLSHSDDLTPCGGELVRVR